MKIAKSEMVWQGLMLYVGMYSTPFDSTFFGKNVLIMRVWINFCLIWFNQPNYGLIMFEKTIMLVFEVIALFLHF